MKMTKKTFLAFVLILTLFASLGHVTVSAMPAPKLTELTLHPEFLMIRTEPEPRYLLVGLKAIGTARNPLVEVSGFPCPLIAEEYIWDGNIGIGKVYLFKTNIRVYGNEENGFYTDYKDRTLTVTAQAYCGITWNTFYDKKIIPVKY